MKSHIDPTYKNNDHVQAIYNAAINQKKHTLLNILGQNISIDICHGRSTALMQCAYDDNQAAVNFLIANGASIHWAIRGTAMRGDKNGVDQLLSRGGSIAWAIEGFVHGGYFLLMADYIKTSNMKPSSHYFHQLLLGLALGNHHQKLIETLNAGIEYCCKMDNDDLDNNTKHNNEFNAVLFSIALASDHPLITSILLEDEMNNTKPVYKESTGKIARMYQSIIEGYAMAGNVDKVEKFLIKKPYYADAVKGFKSIGNFNEARKYEILNKYGHGYEKGKILLELKKLKPEDEKKIHREISEGSSTVMGTIFYHQRGVKECVKARGRLRDSQKRLIDLENPGEDNNDDKKETSGCRIS